jgi:hypothetical protein
MNGRVRREKKVGKYMMLRGVVLTTTQWKEEIASVLKSGKFQAFSDSANILVCGRSIVQQRGLRKQLQVPWGW